MYGLMVISLREKDKITEGSECINIHSSITNKSGIIGAYHARKPVQAVTCKLINHVNDGNVLIIEKQYQSAGLQSTVF